MKNEFPEALTSFFGQYLELQKGLSPNTVSSYSDAFLLLFAYYKEIYRVLPNRITFQSISQESIMGFCKWLETDRKSSIKTRNLRLTAIHAFFRYIEMHDPSKLALCKSILNIPMKKCEKKPPAHLSEEELKLLFAEPDVKKKGGIRDLAIMTLLYDTGTRVSELIGLKIEDVRLEKGTATVRVLGKGRKQRIVPISSATADIVKAYYKSSRIDVGDPHRAIFTNSRGETLTRPGVNYILDKYVKRVRQQNPDKYNFKITAHTMRHSKATVLLLSDVNLVYIRDFLGHASVVSTEIYAKTNPEFLRRAIEKNARNYTDAIGEYDPDGKEALTEFLKTFRK
jgi:site-specific recombinase XerD